MILILFERREHWCSGANDTFRSFLDYILTQLSDYYLHPERNFNVASWAIGEIGTGQTKLVYYDLINL
jgi:hypothetical protein